MTMLYALGRFSRVFVLLPVLFAIGLAMLVASTTGIFLRAMRLMIFLAPVMACVFLFAPEHGEEQGAKSVAHQTQPAHIEQPGNHREHPHSLLESAAR